VSQGERAGAPPTVTAVVVNWNGGDEVVACLRSLHEHPPSGTWEAIVVDNASKDGSPERVAAELPSVRVIRNGQNLGLAAGNNQGIRASRSPFVLISNPDVYYQPGTVDALRDLLERRKRAAFAFARLRDPDGTLQTSAGDLPTLREALLGRAYGRGRQNGRRGFWWHDWDHDTELPIGHGLEACYLVRRSALDEIGLQDEGFSLDWEGVDWARRAAAAGWESWHCPRAEVVHTGGVSIRQVKYRWVVLSHRGMYRYFRTQLPAAARPLAAGIIGLRAGVKIGLAAAGVHIYDRGH
jgi:N-acetylglucosaminyl-diphospho-decaprenol L-rhamnosyltransferase